MRIGVFGGIDWEVSMAFSFGDGLPFFAATTACSIAFSGYAE
jgi:hypothetical protein